MLQAPMIRTGGSGRAPQVANSEISMWAASNSLKSVNRLRMPRVARENQDLIRGEAGLRLYWGISPWLADSSVLMTESLKKRSCGVWAVLSSQKSINRFQMQSSPFLRAYQMRKAQIAPPDVPLKL